jgi:chromate transporter
MREDDALVALVYILAPLSLAAIGGAQSIYAPLQHQVVDVRSWLTPRDYIDLFAVSRVMPGPGSFLATLIGWKVAGWGGAIVATFAIFLPSSLLCLVVTGFWNRGFSPAWRRSIEAGLLPIGAGLMFAGVLSVMEISGADALAWILLATSAVIMALRSRIHPLWLLAAGGLISCAWAAARAALM